MDEGKTSMFTRVVKQSSFNEKTMGCVAIFILRHSPNILLTSDRRVRLFHHEFTTTHDIDALRQTAGVTTHPETAQSIDAFGMRR